jgi:hypothetical protein
LKEAVQTMNLPGMLIPGISSLLSVRNVNNHHEWLKNVMGGRRKQKIKH